MISVCIPTYNGEKFLLSQLSSILEQIGEKDEIIVSDDSSSDNTLNIIDSFGDSRIKVYVGNQFRSPVKNLENALRKAKGDYIFISDQDDVWRNNKVEITLKNLHVANIVVSDCSLINECGEEIHDSFFKLNRSKAGFFNNVYRNSYLGCCMAFDRKVLNLVLPFPKNIAMHDIWIGVVSELAFKSIFINEKLIYYRRHGENFSSTSEKSEKSITQKIGYRFYLVAAALFRVLMVNKRHIHL